MKNQQPINVDVLFVALTRQASVMGLPYEAIIFEAFFTMVVFMMAGNPFYLLVIVPIHLVFYAISADDAGKFDAIQKWLITSGKCLNFRYWQAVSFSPNIFNAKKRKVRKHE